MKAADAKRAAVLVDARADLAKARREIVKRPHRRALRRLLELSVFDEDSGGGQSDTMLYVDQATGAKILAIVDRLISDELKALGVTR